MLQSAIHRLTADPHHTAARMPAVRLAELAAALDREADDALHAGRAALAERLSQHASALREKVA